MRFSVTDSDLDFKRSYLKNETMYLLLYYCTYSTIQIVIRSDDDQMVICKLVYYLNGDKYLHTDYYHILFFTQRKMNI